MGFKRTSEGRVFFQGGAEGQGNQPQPLARNSIEQHGTGILQSQQMQAQIVTLLRALNERLKAAQADKTKMERELESYRALIENLEDRAQRSERAYMDLEHKITNVSSEKQTDDHTTELIQETMKELQETRRHLLDLEDKAERANRGVATLTGRQTTLETLQREQTEKITASTSSFADLGRKIRETEEKQESLNAKIEETSAQQARLTRKIDKAIEDRIRFMRKIERIEETVIQTRDSLNARAMVLLTDQSAASMQESEINQEIGNEAFHQFPGAQIQGQPLPSESRFQLSPPWWRSRQSQTVSMMILVAVSLVGGWYVSEIQKPKIQGSSSYVSAQESSIPGETQETSDLATTTADEALPHQNPELEIPAQDESAAQDEPSGIAALDWSVDTGAAPPPQVAEKGEKTTETPSASVRSNDDIGALDISNQEDVEKLLEKTPEEAGAILNNLEPSPPTAASIAPLRSQTEPTEKTALTPGDTTPPLPDPHKLIKPDSALPDLVKEIEKQAFAGVPEAQHDLAAIYTAGHGGVKQNYKRAAFWFEQAATHGIANAAYNLGVLNHQGLGMKADMKKALDWYARAAALGHPEAQYNLGIAYIEGIGVGYDPEKAADFFQKAADKNIVEAAYNLGLIYENGLLGEAKPDEALMWYKTAADQGSPEARQALEQLAKSLNIKIEDVNRLVENMKTTRKSEASPTETGSSTNNKMAAERNTSSTPPSLTVASMQGKPEAGLIAQIQEYLQRAGLFPGPADGTDGPLTEDAIRAYQKKHGLHPDGRATESLLTHMLASTLGTKAGAG